MDTKLREQIDVKIEPATVGFYATDDNTYGGPPDPCGWGLTPEAAEADLVEAFEADDWLMAYLMERANSAERVAVGNWPLRKLK